MNFNQISIVLAQLQNNQSKIVIDEDSDDTNTDKSTSGIILQLNHISNQQTVVKQSIEHNMAHLNLKQYIDDKLCDCIRVGYEQQQNNNNNPISIFVIVCFKKKRNKKKHYKTELIKEILRGTDIKIQKINKNLMKALQQNTGIQRACITKQYILTTKYDYEDIPITYDKLENIRQQIAEKLVSSYQEKDIRKLCQIQLLTYQNNENDEQNNTEQRAKLYYELNDMLTTCIANHIETNISKHIAQTANTQSKFYATIFTKEERITEEIHEAMMQVIANHSISININLIISEEIETFTDKTLNHENHLANYKFFENVHILFKDSDEIFNIDILGNIQAELVMQISLWAINTIVIDDNIMRTTRDARCMMLLGPTSTGKSFILNSISRLFNGKQLRTLDLASSFYTPGIIKCGIWILDELAGKSLQLLGKDQNKLLTDTQAHKTFKIKCQDDITGGQHIPTVMVSNNNLLSLCINIYQQQNSFESMVDPLLRRFTIFEPCDIIQSKHSYLNSNASLFSKMINLMYPNKDYETIMDRTIAAMIIWLLKKLNKNMYLKQSEQTKQLYNKISDIIEQQQIARLLENNNMLEKYINYYQQTNVVKSLKLQEIEKMGMLNIIQTQSLGSKLRQDSEATNEYLEIRETYNNLLYRQSPFSKALFAYKIEEQNKLDIKTPRFTKWIRDKRITTHITQIDATQTNDILETELIKIDHAINNELYYQLKQKEKEKEKEIQKAKIKEEEKLEKPKFEDDELQQSKSHQHIYL